LGVAFGASHLFGVSLALGAFFAGMVLSESELSHQAAQESLPLRDAFAVLFFVSVGMLFDPSIIWREPMPFLATLFIILFGKSLAAFVIVRVFRHPVRTALTISASLAQIGEFSFILAELGIGLDLLPERARGLILAGAIISIMVNPLMFAAMDWLLKRAGTRWEEAKPLVGGQVEVPKTAEEPLSATELENHVVLVGYGRVGSLVGKSLQERGTPFLVIEDTDTVVAHLRKAGVEVIVGNAAKPAVLKAANLSGARCMVVAIPNAFEAGQTVQQARTANPSLKIIARAHSDPQVEHLTGLGVDIVVMGEREIARGITERLFAEAIQ
jgi:monovalent cation:H+ antiporter-2, CPA2 family